MENPGLLLHLVNRCTLFFRPDFVSNCQITSSLVGGLVQFNTSKINSESKSEPIVVIMVRSFCCAQYFKDTMQTNY